MVLALIVVDVQNDFCPGGALAVRNGDVIVPRLNGVIEAFDKAGLPMLFTRDWHPSDHVSFREQGGIWPSHCVQNTLGSAFHQGLFVPNRATIISKGDKAKEEAYSGFQGTDLEERLRALNADELFIGGLATDYCVKETSLDAIHYGFAVNLLTDCIMAVDVNPGDGAEAIREIRKAGANLVDSKAAIERIAGAHLSSHREAGP